MKHSIPAPSLGASLVLLASLLGWIETAGAQDTPLYAVQLKANLQPWDRSAFPRIDSSPGRHVYVTRFDRGGKTWHRLRFGMFETLKAAKTSKAAIGKRFPGAWVARVAPGEHKRFVSQIWAARTVSKAAKPPPTEPMAAKPPSTEPMAAKLPSTESMAAAPAAAPVVALPPQWSEPALTPAAGGEPTAAPETDAIQAMAAGQTQDRIELAEAKTDQGGDKTRKASYPMVSHDFDGRVEAGYDSNPLKLNNEFTGSVSGRVKLGYDLTYRYAKRQKVFAGAELDLRRYDIEEADRNKGQVEIGFSDSWAGPGAGRLRTTFGARYGFRTLTFVDQNTGQEETSSGTAIGTRFDADWIDLFAEFRTDVTEAATLTLDGRARFKDNRDDFGNIGLDQLDYNEYGLEPRIRFNLGVGVDVRIKAPLALRVYDDRRAEDIAGNEVAGSDLEYYYYGIDASIGNRKSKSMRWRLGVEAEQREDNESGFNDRITYGAYARATFGRRDGNRFAISAKVSRREFDQVDLLAIDDVNDGGRVKEGARIRLSYTNPIELYSGFDMDLVMFGSGEIFENSDSDFSYARFTAGAGLRKKF